VRGKIKECISFVLPEDASNIQSIEKSVISIN
jgi:hypothetical protein